MPSDGGRRASTAVSCAESSRWCLACDGIRPRRRVRRRCNETQRRQVGERWIQLRLSFDSIL